MKRIILIVVVFLCTISYGQKKKTTKSIDQQVKEFYLKFDKLTQSQKRAESNKLVSFLNTTDSQTRAAWMSAMDKYEKTLKSNEIKAENKVESKSFETIRLTTFSKIPEELAGCSFLFSHNKAMLGKNQFLYFDDMGTTAIIAIKGTAITLKRSSSFTEGEDEIGIYSNNEYSAYIHSKKYLGDNSDESQIYSAELVVKDKNGHETKIKVYGEGGC